MYCLSFKQSYDYIYPLLVHEADLVYWQAWDTYGLGAWDTYGLGVCCHLLGF